MQHLFNDVSKEREVYAGKKYKKCCRNTQGISDLTILDLSAIQ